MVSQEDLSYAALLNQISNQLVLYFSYSIPWTAIFTSLLVLGVLFFAKRIEKILIILVFKAEYIISLVFALNMILNDDVFSFGLFKYLSTQNVDDIVCKLHLVLMKYFYCMAPWMQVIISFDRLWSVVFVNKWKFKRTTKTLTLFILGVQGFVFLTNLVNVAYYAKASVGVQTQLDPVLNVSVKVNKTKLTCAVISKDMQTTQDILFVFMRIIIPMFTMIICSYYLIKHVLEVRRRIIRGRNQKRENHFTVAVAFTNVAFFVFNLPITVYYIIYYYIILSKVSLTFLGNVQFSLFFSVSYLFSYMFTLCQFWIDLAFNRIFRKEIFAAVFFLLPKKFNRVASETPNRSINTAR